MCWCVTMFSMQLLTLILSIQLRHLHGKHAPRIACKMYNLTVYDCSWRHLDSFPKFLQKRITVLDLSANDIVTVTSNSFHGHPELEKIALRSNYIDEIHRLAFSGLHNLTILWLLTTQLDSYRRMSSRT